MQTQKDKRVVEFIRLKGGDSAVARVTGLKPQTLQVVTSGKSGAGEKIMEALAMNFEDFDLDYMYKGVTSEKVKQKPIDIESELKELEIKVGSLTNEVVLKDKALIEKESELKVLNESVLSLEGQIKAYQNMIQGIITFPRPITDEEVEKKRKAGNFRKAPEGARIMHLNFNRNTNKYQPSEVIISEVGFIPMWKREQNASRA